MIDPMNLTPVYEKNLAKTLELIDLCFQLKEAYLRQRYPSASPLEIRQVICSGILARKERQWTSPDPSSKP
jgi:hypothetical protein